MKKKLILLVMLLITAFAVAQPPKDYDKVKDHHREKNDKINALAVAYITEQLDMSSKEAQEFWPVYNRIKGEYHGFEKEKRTILRKLEGEFDTLEEPMAQDYVNQLIALEEKINNSSLEMHHNELIAIIGAKRFLQLKKAEMDFRRKMIKEFKERRIKRE
jgi:Skp family chaperone for outer membrane proteins